MRGLIVAAAVCGLVAGCGSSETAKPITAADLIQEVEEHSGDLLVRDDKYSTREEIVLDFGEALDEYGALTIYLWERDADGSWARMTDATDKADYATYSLERERLEKEGSLVWRQSCYEYERGRCSWTVTKRYGENVAVRWQAGRKQETDETWERLDGVLTAATGAG